MRKRLTRYVLYALLVVLLAPAGLLLLYRVIPPPITPLMILRGRPREYHWVPLAAIAPPQIATTAHCRP